VVRAKLRPNKRSGLEATGQQGKKNSKQGRQGLSKKKQKITSKS